MPPDLKTTIMPLNNFDPGILKWVGHSEIALVIMWTSELQNTCLPSVRSLVRATHTPMLLVPRVAQIDSLPIKIQNPACQGSANKA